MVEALPALTPSISISHLVAPLFHHRSMSTKSVLLTHIFWATPIWTLINILTMTPLIISLQLWLTNIIGVLRFGGLLSEPLRFITSPSWFLALPKSTFNSLLVGKWELVGKRWGVICFLS
jgi:hypothetical protein